MIGVEEIVCSIGSSLLYAGIYIILYEFYGLRTDFTVSLNINEHKHSKNGVSLLLGYQ